MAQQAAGYIRTSGCLSQAHHRVYLHSDPNPKCRERDENNNKYQDASMLTNLRKSRRWGGALISERRLGLGPISSSKNARYVFQYGI